jgi:23S rRNA (guanine2445-N2)-methyltransferase / 23S rRNA (guanine2069-N7)-methyltransferase
MRRAGVAELVTSSTGDFRALSPAGITQQAAARGVDPTRGVIVCNPPYGERLAPDALFALYRDLGEWCRRFHGWRAALIVANPDFEQAFGGVPRIKKPLSNGALRGYFLLYET